MSITNIIGLFAIVNIFSTHFPLWMAAFPWLGPAALPRAELSEDCDASCGWGVGDGEGDEGKKDDDRSDRDDDANENVKGHQSNCHIGESLFYSWC